MAESTSESVVEFAFILFVGIALIGFIGGSASLKESEKQSVTLVETVETVGLQEEVVYEVQKESGKESS